LNNTSSDVILETSSRKFCNDEEIICAPGYD
jgi:hypothetical protein